MKLVLANILVAYKPIMKEIKSIPMQKNLIKMD